MERLELETHGHAELKKKHQHTELEVQRMCQNLKFAEDNAERLAQENLDLKNANGQLQVQMTQIISKIQGHFKMDKDNQLISNDEWNLQQEITRLKEHLAHSEKEKEKLTVLNFELRKEVPDPEKYDFGDDLNGSVLEMRERNNLQLSE